jgi:hypothetical protein
MPLYMFLHSLLNVLVQIANKMGLQKKNLVFISCCLVTVPNTVDSSASLFMFQLPHRFPWSQLLKLIYHRQSVGQSVLVSGTHLGPATKFSFFLRFSLDSCRFVILGHLTRIPSPPQSYYFVFLGRPLWREVGSVMCQSLSLKSTWV